MPTRLTFMWLLKPGRLERLDEVGSPVLDLPGRPPRTWQLSGKQETPVTHARRQPEPRQNRIDTAPLLQG